MAWPFVVDLLVIILLAATIVFGAVLDRRLGALRRDRHDLEELAESFRQATERAEQSIGKLKLTAESLQQRLDKTQSLSEDLAYLIERGTAVADRIENAIRAARKHGDAPAAVSVPPVAKRRAVGVGESVRPRSEAERELLNAVRSMR